MFSFSRVYAAVTPNATINVRSANVRTTASSTSALITTIMCGHRVQIVDLVVGQFVSQYGDDHWYLISFVDTDAVEKTGYVLRPFLLLDSTTPLDPVFEESIAAFPDSYKIYLRALHEKYPNWIFVPFITNLDYNAVVTAESRIGISLIEDYRDDAWQSTFTTNDATLPGWTPTFSDAYNWLTDTYIPYDASRWVNASTGFVSYSLDPRNFLSDTQIFQFLLLSYDASSQNIETVQSLLTGTFMESALITNLAGEQVSYAQAIMDAAATYQVNPYFLVARIKQEILLSTGQPCGTASGTYPGYEGYYNFYNIGAVSDPDPVVPALTYAKSVSTNPDKVYLRPWNSQYKAILGGAMWIENGYISATRAQDTLYFQRWNVIYLEQLYRHQYMTSTEAPVSEAIRLQTAYKDILNLPLVFKIPVYTNMPSTPVLPPATKGNPNNWLLSMSVEGQSLTPSFDPNTLNYDLIVGNEMTSINVAATMVSAKSTLTGTGTQMLSVGDNDCVISVTAQNGSVRNYTLHIVRAEPAAAPLFTSGYRVNGLNLSGLTVGSTAPNFLAGLTMLDGATAVAYDASGLEISDLERKIRTGDQLKVYDSANNLVATYTLIIYGDANGDGKISSSDLTVVYRHVLKYSYITGPFLMAANANHDGKTSSSDLTMLYRHVLKYTEIDQRG
jgi:beta-N-acetylglucosaminidase